jgi:hypothetical protein
MQETIDLLAAPISNLHNAVLSDGSKDLIAAFTSYVTTYANIVRNDAITDDDRRAILAAIETLSKINKEVKDLIKVVGKGEPYQYDDVEIKYGDVEIKYDDFYVPLPRGGYGLDDNFEILFEHEKEFNLPEIALAYGELEIEFDDSAKIEEGTKNYEEITGNFEKIVGNSCEVESAGEFLLQLGQYIEAQIQRYKVPALFSYEHTLEGTEKFKMALNNELSYEGDTRDAGDVLIFLSTGLDIVDYLDYEIVKSNVNSMGGPYEGFDKRISAKKNISTLIEKAVENFKEPNCKIQLSSLSKIIEQFEQFISPELKETCIKKVINFVAASKRGDEKAKQYSEDSTDPIAGNMQYISLYN